MVQVFIDTHGRVFFFSAATLATASTKRQTLHSTAEVITTTDMTTDIISPFTWSSASTHTQQPTPIKPQSTTPTSSESFVTSNSGATTSATASTKRQTLHSTAESIATTDMTTDIISPFTWSSASTHTQQPTPVKPQSTTPTSSESFVTSDSDTQSYPTHFSRFSSTHLQVTNNVPAATGSENIINPNWFYFFSVLIIPIGICFVFLYKRRGQHHSLQKRNIIQQRRTNAGVYLPIATSLALDTISLESTFAVSENVSFDSSDNTSIVNENIYESVRTLNEQDGYLVPQSSNRITKL